jgi:hypothetical protein
MKNFCLYLILLQSTWLFAQPKFDAKRDYVWIFGIESFSLDTVDHIYLDFRTDTMSLKYRRAQGQNLFQTNASICDTAGNLLFFSNGCVIVDSGFQYVQGADTINRGPWWTYSCDGFSDRTDGYLIVNGCWALPVAENKFKVIYADIINQWAHTSGVRFATINKDTDSGALVGFEPDTYLHQKDINSKKPAIVRHANGRDWWRIDEGYGERRYYITFIDSSQSIFPCKEQFFPQISTSMYRGGGQACFTPDGSKFCAIDAFECQVFDFDRCTGEMNNPVYIPLPVPSDSLYGVTGIAVSPNSRFMYLMIRRSIWQYDLTSSDIDGTRIKVGNYNGFLANGYETSFYQSQLGPDGKIYIFPPGCRSTLSVIEYPDSIGVACGVSQFKYYFPDWGGICQPPRFPNFRLGPEVGSACDTLTSSVKLPEEIGSFILRPNPATNYTVADITTTDFSESMQLEIEISALGGTKIDNYHVPPYAALQRIETGHLPNGMYFITLKSKGIVLKTEKLVVLRE